MPPRCWFPRRNRQIEHNQCHSLYLFEYPHRLACRRKRFPKKHSLVPLKKVANSSRRLNAHILRALKKIRKPSTAEEITDLLNRDLDPGDALSKRKTSQSGAKH